MVFIVPELAKMAFTKCAHHYTGLSIAQIGNDLWQYEYRCDQHYWNILGLYKNTHYVRNYVLVQAHYVEHALPDNAQAVWRGSMKELRDAIFFQLSLKLTGMIDEIQLTREVEDGTRYSQRSW